MLILIRHVIRRCRWLVFRMILSLAEFVFLGPLSPSSVTQKLKCGRFKVHLVDLDKGDIQDLARRQKELADMTVSVMENPMLSPCVRKVFEKIQVFIIVNGTVQSRLLFLKVFFIRKPPLNELRKGVRLMISFILWESKFRDEYFIQCRSNAESRTIATEFMNQSMREVDVALAEAMGALCDSREDEQIGLTSDLKT